MESLEQTKSFLFKHYENGNQHRLRHILGVAEMAKYLAAKYNYDPIKAQIAAYMHDYAKYDSIEEIKKYLSLNEIEECEKYPFLYHAYGSAYIYKEYIGNDEDIFNAIYNHVFGRCNMSLLEQIIMISDYTEINREYPDCIKCRDILINEGIDKAILYSLENTINHVKKKNEAPHPIQLEVYREYLNKVGK